MKEGYIEKALVTEVRQCGGRAYKWVSPGNAGVPDRIIFFPNRVVFVELKTDTGKLTDVQAVQIRELLRLGQVVYVCRGLKGVADFFDQEGFPEAAARIRKKIERYQE